MLESNVLKAEPVLTTDVRETSEGRYQQIDSIDVKKYYISHQITNDE